MESETFDGSDGLVDPDRLGRVAVLRFHKPPRFVGPDGNQADVGGTAFAMDIGKHLVVPGGVSTEVGGAASRVDEKTAPQAPVSRSPHAIAPMTSGRGANMETEGDFISLPPVKFDDAGGGEPAKLPNRAVAQGRD